MKDITLYVLVDENGDWVMADDASDLSNRHSEDIGGLEDLAHRTIEINLRVPLPKPSLTVVTAELPEVPGDAPVQANVT